MRDRLSRREFIAVSAGIAAASGARGAEVWKTFPSTVIKANDDAVARGMSAQRVAVSHPFFGGIPDSRELYHAGDAGRFIKRAVASYFCDGSRYQGDGQVLERVRLALAYLERSQSSDGNIDLLTTNFNSPPDTGFVVHSVASAANIARLHDADNVLALFEKFLTAAGSGMAKGGIHTPNHRWVVSAALAQIHELFPDDSYVKRIDTWLAEGIDIDEEGQYTERSTGGYNATCNEAFVTMAEKLGRPELLEPVRKNLDAMAYLLHPNGEVVTEVSNRQDRNTRATMERYWFPLRYMAIRDKNGLYASMLMPLEPGRLELPRLMEYPLLNESLPATAPIPNDYVVDLPRSGITRIRRGKMSATIIHEGNSRWMSIHNGDAVMNGIRFASAFFGKGQFRPETFERRGDDFYFSQSMEGPYYQPITDASRLPVEQKNFGASKRNRKRTEVATMQYEGHIRETERGFELTIRATGTEGVPLAIEINLRPNATLSGVDSLGDDRFLLREGTAQCTVGNDTISFGPGIAEHRYVQIRGAEAKLDGPSVYLTAYTPFETTLEIGTS